MSDTELNNSTICNAYDSDADEYFEAQEPCDIGQFDNDKEDYVDSDEDYNTVDSTKVLIPAAQLREVIKRYRQRYQEYELARNEVLDFFSDTSNDLEKIETLFNEFQKKYLQFRSIAKLIHYFNEIYLETQRIFSESYDVFRAFVEEELPIEFYKDLHRDYTHFLGMYLVRVRHIKDGPVEPLPAPKPKPRPIQYSRPKVLAAPVIPAIPAIPAVPVSEQLVDHISKYHTRIRYDVCSMHTIKCVPVIANKQSTTFPEVVDTICSDDNSLSLCLAKQEKWFNQLVSALRKVKVAEVFVDETDEFPHLSNQPLMCCSGVYRYWIFMEVVCKLIAKKHGFQHPFDVDVTSTHEIKFRYHVANQQYYSQYFPHPLGKWLYKEIKLMNTKRARHVRRFPMPSLLRFLALYLIGGCPNVIEDTAVLISKPILYKVMDLLLLYNLIKPSDMHEKIDKFINQFQITSEFKGGDSFCYKHLCDTLLALQWSQPKKRTLEGITGMFKTQNQHLNAKKVQAFLDEQIQSLKTIPERLMGMERLGEVDFQYFTRDKPQRGCGPISRFKQPVCAMTMTRGSAEGRTKKRRKGFTMSKDNKYNSDIEQEFSDDSDSDDESDSDDSDFIPSSTGSSTKRSRV